MTTRNDRNEKSEISNLVENEKSVCDIKEEFDNVVYNIQEITNIFDDLYQRLIPVLLPEQTSIGEKTCDSVVSTRISPLATEIRVIKYQLVGLKSKMIDVVGRIQL